MGEAKVNSRKGFEVHHNRKLFDKVQIKESNNKSCYCGTRKNDFVDMS